MKLANKLTVASIVNVLIISVVGFSLVDQGDTGLSIILSITLVVMVYQVSLISKAGRNNK